MKTICITEPCFDQSILVRTMSVLICIFLVQPFAHAEDSANKTPPEIASRALDYLRKEGQRWIDRRECVSCHQIPAMVWSLNAAHGSGLSVERTEVNDLAKWSTDHLHFVESKDRADAECDDVLEKNTDTMAALLLALPPSENEQSYLHAPDASLPECGNGSDDVQDQDSWRVTFADALIRNQNADGSWDPKGQLPSQKRDPQETRRVSTLWITYALLKEGQTEDDFKLAGALAFVDEGASEDNQPKSAEWWATRLLVADQLGETTVVDRTRKILLSAQQNDGGWGWLLADKSDALATGIVLYALSTIKPDSDAVKPPVVAAIQRATKFLGTTQLANGSWKVPGTKKNSRNRSVPTSNYWGTAWAVIGLLAADH
ncbi:MAG: prenyltransferase/squalene oxidase repeat-containing protein [Aureliella sp.]